MFCVLNSVFCTTFHTLHRKHYFWKVRCYCRVGTTSGIAHSRDSRSHPLSNYQTFLFSHCNSIHFPEPRTCHVHPVAISFTELSLVHSFLNVIETSLLGLLTRIFLSRLSYVHLVHCTFPVMVWDLWFTETSLGHGLPVFYRDISVGLTGVKVSVAFVPVPWSSWGE